jgi:hypothetical protein
MKGDHSCAGNPPCFDLLPQLFGSNDATYCKNALLRLVRAFIAINFKQHDDPLSSAEGRVLSAQSPLLA